jgi:hypothetical protein
MNIPVVESAGTHILGVVPPTPGHLLEGDTDVYAAKFPVRGF